MRWELLPGLAQHGVHRLRQGRGQQQHPHGADDGPGHGPGGPPNPNELTVEVVSEGNAAPGPDNDNVANDNVADIPIAHDLPNETPSINERLANHVANVNLTSLSEKEKTKLIVLKVISILEAKFDKMSDEDVEREYIHRINKTSVGDLVAAS